MGCTPSLHVSQTGVIYCQDSDESPSSCMGSHQKFTGIQGRFKSDPLTPETFSANTQSETSDVGLLSAAGSLNPVGGNPQERPKWVPPQAENNVLELGSFHASYNPLKLMLIFPREDAQSDSFWWAAERLQYQTDLVTSVEAALLSYQQKYHDVIIVDGRSSNVFEASAVCRSIRSINGSNQTVIVAVIKKNLADKEDATTLPLLSVGFDRCFIECPSLGICLNELIQLEINDVRSKIKLELAQVLLTALNNCRDVVEITNSKLNIQFINRMGEKLLGYTSDEVRGKSIQNIHKIDSLKSDMYDSINSQLHQGKEWEGSYLCRRKSGDAISLPCKIIPVSVHGNEITHHIYIKECLPRWDRTLTEISNNKDGSNISTIEIFPYHRGSVKSIRKGSYEIKTFNNEALMNRRQSMAKIHAMTIEAPIIKVINLISAAQENCPGYIAQALEKVIDILRSTELYSPQLLNQQNRNDDPMTVDLLGGLLSQGPKIPIPIRRQSEISFFKGNNQPVMSLTNMSTIPSNIKLLLENETNWDFDVIELEKITSKRPLVWLGMAILARFRAGSLMNCSESVIQNWLTLIEANYHSQNPYHNSTHAADVLQCTAYFLSQENIKQIFDPLDELACLIAAIVHDVDHPGKNSAFLCNSNNELAILYNDLSVLESHHSALAFKLTNSDDRVNIFKNMDRDEFRSLRQSIIDMVLATEMTKHFEHLAKFVNLFPKQTLNNDDTSLEEGCFNSPDLASIASSSENIILIKRMLIKCADVSNPTRKLDLCIEWAFRIAEEYFQQTEEEKKKNLPVVMPVFDRSTCSIPKSQISFIDYFISDMFDAWDVFADLPELMENLHKNYNYWKEQDQQQTLQTIEQVKS